MDMELLATRPNKQIFQRGTEKVKLFGAQVPTADVLEEALYQTLAQEAGLPVPPLREVTKMEGQWAVVSDYIPGQTLLWHMEQAPQRLQEFLALFVRLQLQVHAARAPRLQRQKDRLHRQLSASRLDATTRYELHIRLDSMPAHLKVCHGDFVPSNVILNDGQAYIIDWAHVTLGNASADIANTYLTLLRLGCGAWAQSYLALACEMSDTARQYVQKWIPVIAGSHLAYCPSAQREFYAAFCADIV
jgi:tRNA A-37 threonylcarbamoyl transferase component Bud32